MVSLSPSLYNTVSVFAFECFVDEFQLSFLFVKIWVVKKRGDSRSTQCSNVPRHNENLNLIFLVIYFVFQNILRDCGPDGCVAQKQVVFFDFSIL
jgi:hypothetical protein